MRVLLVDDRPDRADGGWRPTSGDGLELVGTVASAADARARLDDLRPDVLVLEPLADATELIPLVSALTDPATGAGLVVLSERPSENELLDSVVAGADGYLAIDLAPAGMARAVAAAADGELAVSRRMGGWLVEHLAARAFAGERRRARQALLRPEIR